MNGVAHTSRHFEAFARRRNLPFLCVRAGDRAQTVVEDGNVWTLELPRGFLSFALEKDLRFDPAFLRHIPLIGEVLERFQPDLIHITGPSEVGILGAWLAHHLHLPLAASWHTNRPRVRRAPRRIGSCACLPERHSAATGQKIEDLAMAAAARFYSIAQVLFAPNPELCALLEQATGRPCHLMPRGVDAELFHPAKRTRNLEDRERILGFVGRLSVEKNIALLLEIQQELERMGVENFRFLIVGHGGDEAWLRERLHRARVHRRPARAKRSPRPTPTWTSSFSPRIPTPSATWCLRLWPAACPPSSLPTAARRHSSATAKPAASCPTTDLPPPSPQVLADPAQHAAMRHAARAYALTASWDSVFEGIYATYESILPQEQQAAV